MKIKRFTKVFSSNRIFFIRANFVIALVLVFFISSCKKDPNIKEAENNIGKDEQLYNVLLQSGVKPENIKDVSEYYLVEDDMLFKKNKTDINKVKAYYGINDISSILLSPGLTVNNRGEKLSSLQSNKISQWRTNNLISSFNVENIKVNNYYTTWTADISGAVYNWRDISNCKINFYENYLINSSSPNSITFINSGNDPELVGAYAIAEFPSSDNAGYRIRINNTLYNNLSLSQKTFILTHEMGHCVGLRHTNWQGYEYSAPNGAIQIPGTPTTDVSSIMNRGGAAIVPNWTGFSNYDIIAAQTLYPYNSYDKWINDYSIPLSLYNDLKFTLTWDQTLVNTSTVSIELFQFGISKGIIAKNVLNNGSSIVDIITPELTSYGNNYLEVQLKIIADDNPGIFDFSKLFYCRID